MSNGMLRVGVMFGGKSPEHDVSIVTALQVMAALDPEQYHIIPIYIATDGQWYTGEGLRARSLFIPGPEELKALSRVILDVGHREKALLAHRTELFSFAYQKHVELDVIIPAFHGLMGEDGRIQGLLEIANLPYTGMRVLASALLMDKIATKRFLEVSGIPQLPFAEIRRPKQGRLLTVAELAPMVGNIAFPACIKPVNLGSSIGVAKVAGLEELADIVPDIFKYDDRAMLEPFVQNLAEYNIAVARLGARITTSAIERPRSTAVLLDFKTKYLSGPSDKTGQKTPGSSSQGMLSLTRDINPTIPKDMETNIRQWASRCFELVGGTGSPRLDFLCNEATGEVWFNEVNPCPGSFAYFLWENAAEPLLFSQLLDHLIQEGRGLHAAVQLPSDPTPVDARLFPRRG